MLIYISHPDVILVSLKYKKNKKILKMNIDIIIRY